MSIQWESWCRSYLLKMLIMVPDSVTLCCSPRRQNMTLAYWKIFGADDAWKCKKPVHWLSTYPKANQIKFYITIAYRFTVLITFNNHYNCNHQFVQKLLQPRHDSCQYKFCDNTFSATMSCLLSRTLYWLCHANERTILLLIFC